MPCACAQCFHPLVKDLQVYKARSTCLIFGAFACAGLGALHVCDLKSASPEDMHLPALTLGCAAEGVSIFITSLLTDAHRHLLKAVLSHTSLRRVSIYSTLSEHAHACQARSFLGVEAYSEYARMLRQQVKHCCGILLPLHLCVSLWLLLLNIVTAIDLGELSH